ncbi:MAG TPA: hypothetical protein VGV18_02870 [Verrucomicrobiae bacterium]|nr:hypothetical protein [Verrucomicrobiae bacterium]
MQRKLYRQEQLAVYRRRYQERGNEGKSRLLDEFCEHYGYERKYAIKLLGGAVRPAIIKRPPPGPARRYGAILEVVERVWSAAEQLCGKRLVGALPLWLPHYERHYGKLLPLQRRLMQEVSAATLDRLLADKKASGGGGLGGTKPGTLLRHQIPIQGEVWNERRVGFMEADSVAHCGNSLAGNFIWSLTYTDLACTWTEGRAIWNKGATGVLDQTRDVETQLPFAIRGFDFDNGSEWLNWTLIRYLQVRTHPIQLSRSRPYHKDDNAHVEQKNWMWPRQLLGYGRLEQAQLVGPINELYKEVWGPLHNFFLPSMKLVKKWRVGSRWVRRYDAPQTAYQRLLASGQLQTAQVARLRQRYESLDPFALAGQVERRLKPILRSSS